MDTKLMGMRICSRRKELHLSQSDFAEKLNISNNHMSSIEKGKAVPSMKLFCEICELLNVEPNYLLLGTLRSDDYIGNLTDKLKLCSKQDILLISSNVDFLLERHTFHKKF